MSKPSEHLNTDIRLEASRYVREVLTFYGYRKRVNIDDLEIKLGWRKWWMYRSTTFPELEILGMDKDGDIARFTIKHATVPVIRRWARWIVDKLETYAR